MASNSVYVRHFPLLFLYFLSRSWTECPVVMTPLPPPPSPPTLPFSILFNIFCKDCMCVGYGPSGAVTVQPTPASTQKVSQPDRLLKARALVLYRSALSAYSALTYRHASLFSLYRPARTGRRRLLRTGSPVFWPGPPFLSPQSI
jgi:hypothetical protein